MSKSKGSRPLPSYSSKITPLITVANNQNYNVMIQQCNTSRLQGVYTQYNH